LSTPISALAVVTVSTSTPEIMFSHLRDAAVTAVGVAST
jgi:hypothetical protein